MKSKHEGQLLSVIHCNHWLFLLQY